MPPKDSEIKELAAKMAGWVQYLLKRYTGKEWDVQDEVDYWDIKLVCTLDEFRFQPPYWDFMRDTDEQIEEWALGVAIRWRMRQDDDSIE